MKIRCGSHQQNRSIVRPGLSLMATKVALTAEEFRENSQRSIALFNTEKLSTDSTHVLKSAYCILCISAVAICTGRVEAKVTCCARSLSQVVAICTGRVEAKVTCCARSLSQVVAICTGRVEAKLHRAVYLRLALWLQSVRGVWRQRVRGELEAHEGRLQSVRGVWRQSPLRARLLRSAVVAICTGRVEAKVHGACAGVGGESCNLYGACGGKATASLCP